MPESLSKLEKLAALWDFWAWYSERHKVPPSYGTVVVSLPIFTSKSVVETYVTQMVEDGTMVRGMGKHRVHTLAGTEVYCPEENPYKKRLQAEQKLIES